MRIYNKHPGILDFSATWQPFETRQVASLRITAVPLNHSRPCFGYVIQSPDKTLAYLTDTVGLPTAPQQFLSQLVLDDCIVDCSFAPRAQPHRNHNDLKRAAGAVREPKGVKHKSLWGHLVLE